MSDKIIKSGITKWDIENIEKVPACMGVFIVRSSPIDDYIIAIEKTEDIKRSLMTIYNEQIYPNVNFFDWYQTIPCI